MRRTGGLQGGQSSGGDNAGSGGTGNGWLVMRVATRDYGRNPTTTASAFVWVSGTTRPCLQQKLA